MLREEEEVVRNTQLCLEIDIFFTNVSTSNSISRKPNRFENMGSIMLVKGEQTPQYVHICHVYLCLEIRIFIQIINALILDHDCDFIG